MGRVVFLAWLIVIGSLHADWEVEQIDGRDYVSLVSTAEFYTLGKPGVAGPKKFATTGGGRSLQVEVDSREAFIDGVRQWLAFPARSHAGGAWVSRTDIAHTVEPALRPDKVKGMRPVRTVVLDAGHGGHDNGAQSRFGQEKEFTLDVVRRLRKRLESAGLRVVLTRNSDSFIELERRPRVANKIGNAIFVSIHFNSAGWKPSANGIETYAISPLGAPPSGQDQVMVRDRNAEPGHALELVNATFATAVQHAIVGKLKAEDRGVKRARFVVLKDASTPAILIEGGFLTNPSDSVRIANASWRESYAAAIAAGILEFKKLAEGGVKPRTKKDW
jgi:N-acetylmuramoyl-L-alanine amidase